MPHKLVFLFAGQGSQYYGMGRELYENHACFRSWMERGSSLAEPTLGISLVKLLYQKRENRFEPFDRTLYTHPAIFLVNFSVVQALREEGLVPSCLVGYSLGEIAALAAAGALSFEESLAFVIQTARLIEERTATGGMLAVLGPPALWQQLGEQFADTTLAAVNYDQHFVVVGRQPVLLRVRSWLKSHGVACQLLPIQHGFHSPLLDPIEEGLKSLATHLRFQAPRQPVVSCMTRRNLAPAELAPQYCWQVLRQPAYFEEAIASLGPERGSHLYVDVGPSGTLASFMNQLKGAHPDSKALPLLTPYGHDLRSLARLKAALNA